MPPITFPEPVLAYAIEPKSRGDEDKIGPAMQRLHEEDPSIGYTRDPQTHELLLAGQGQLHIEVTVAKLRRRFGVEVTLKPPRIPYRETITAKVEAHGRHKKQTGGHGQFGDCKIRMEPLAARRRLRVRRRHLRRRDSRGSSSRPSKRASRTRALRGYLAGYPVVDFRVTVYDGSYHDVDSNELSFKHGRPARVPGRDVARAADAPRADHERRGLRAVGLRRRPHGRSQQPPRPHRRHGHARRGDGHQRHGARWRRC